MALDIGLLVLRLTVGLLLIGHGSQKLFGWFGGHGLEGTGGMFASMRVREPHLQAMLTGSAEFGGGIGLALGLLTPLAAAGVVGVMVGAILLVHWPKLWVTEQGGEYPVVLIAVATLLGLYGAGAYSLDAAMGTSSVLPNPWTYVVAGIASALVAVSVGISREAEHPQTTGRPRALSR